MAKKKVSKLSKKKQKELNAKRRNVWSVKPVTRITPNGKLYSRKRKFEEE